MKYEPRVKPDERNHYVNVGFVIEDLVHAERCLAFMAGELSMSRTAAAGYRADIAALRSQLSAKERECEERDAVIRELVGWGDYDMDVIQASGEDWNQMRTKALALVGGEKGKGK